MPQGCIAGGMDRISAGLQEEHWEQIEAEQESADGDMSDAKALRRRLDRAAEAERLDEEVQRLREELEQERSKRDEAVQQAREEVRQEYEDEIESLESDLNVAQNRIRELEQKLAHGYDKIEATNELVAAEKAQTTILEKKAKASLLERVRWAFTGMPEDDE